MNRIHWELLGVFKDEVVVGRTYVSLPGTFIFKNFIVCLHDSGDGLTGSTGTY